MDPEAASILQFVSVQVLAHQERGLDAPPRLARPSSMTQDGASESSEAVDDALPFAGVLAAVTFALPQSAE